MMIDINQLNEQLKNGNYNIEESVANLTQSHQEILIECCEENYVDLAEWLIRNGNNVDVLTETESRTPLEVSSYMSYIEMVKLLLRFFPKESDEENIIEKRNKTICRSLCACMHRLGTSSEIHIEYNINTKRCFEEIINMIKEINANNFNGIDILKYKDQYEKTALFYTDYYNLPDLKLLLLDTFCLNSSTDGVHNIDRIDAEVLQMYFDTCVIINVEQIENSSVILNYEQLCLNSLNESGFIFMLSEKENYQYLLEHPLIKCYVFLKWYKPVFSFLSYFCITFWFVCTFLNKLITNPIVFFAIVIITCSIHFFLNSSTILNRYHSSKFSERYPVAHFESYFLIRKIKKLFKETFPSSFILLTLLLSIVLPLERRVLLFIINASFALKFIFVLPNYGKVFEIVFYRFFKVLFLFTIVAIVPFALNYQSSVTDQESSSEDKPTEKKQTFVFSFYNIFTLLVGDLDHFNDSSSSEQKAIFLFFIFTFSIVIVNLLNSLAVNDIQQLEKQANIVKLQDEIRFIYSVENFFTRFSSFGKFNWKAKCNLFDSKPKKLEGIVNCQQNNAVYLSREIIESLNVFVQEKKEFKKKIRIISCCVDISNNTKSNTNRGEYLTSSTV